MKTVTSVEARTHLSALLDEIEAGSEVIITRRGRPVARLSAAPAEQDSPLTQKEPLRSLAAFRARMPRLRKPSHVLLREMRDEEL